MLIVSYKHIIYTFRQIRTNDKRSVVLLNMCLLNLKNIAIDSSDEQNSCSQCLANMFVFCFSSFIPSAQPETAADSQLHLWRHQSDEQL